MKMQAILAKVPEYQSFLTVDEMDTLALERASAHPDAVQVFSIGHSRSGGQILCTKIGEGCRNALCFACPHPNEPIGALTVQTMADLFLSDPELLVSTGFTWYLIHCIDPDGTRLNEGWFKGPFTLRHYAENYFRPPGHEQVEWTFPIDYECLHFDKPILETKALMDLIQVIKPTFAFSLHNSAFGGVYWYSTESDPMFCAKLEYAAERQGLPLHLGEPETAYGVKYSPAVHSMMSIKKHIDYLKQYGEGYDLAEFNCGSCSADFINGVCKCLTLMAELPYFIDKRISDTSLVPDTRRSLILEKITQSRRYHEFIVKWYGQVKNFFTDENPFPGLVAEEALRDPRVYDAQAEWALRPEYDNLATMAEKLDNLYLSRYYNCLITGLLRRACQFELDKTTSEESHHILNETKIAVEVEMERQIQFVEENMDYEVIPINKLISVQLESALVATEFLASRTMY